MAMAAAGSASRLQTCIYDDRHVSEAAKIADVVHKASEGCKIVAQINHAGRQGVDEPVGPSELFSRGGRKLKVLSTEEVGELAAQYAEAARRVKEAGFDGAEVHAAHGYLLSSFLSPRTNRRTDKYGGSIQKRATVIKEIVGLAREKVGDDFPILVKANCVYRGSRGTDADSFPETAKEIEKAGADALEISGANPVRMGIDRADKESYFMEYAEKLDLNIPVILTGGNRSVERLEQAFQVAKVDFFGFARPLIREPDLPNRWLEGTGSDTAKCISCNGCLRQLAKGPIYCVVEAAAARERADS
jgi:2,4-dienoyl-CoA reductase-like NADH-dependent reductase (Old Yellow Enzyme family)